MLSVIDAYRPRESGFTLVELALVFLIIGLLAGGALRAQELVANARMATTIKQVQAYQQAVEIFYSSYLAIPGDFNAAQSVLPDCRTETFCYNGDGDGMIGLSAVAWTTLDASLSSENTQAWRHLAQADLIVGVVPSGDASGYGVSHPVAGIYGGFHLRQASAAPNLPSGVVAVLRADPAGAWADASRVKAITPKDAARIDIKMDDGAAFSGYTYAISAGHDDGCGNAGAGNQGANGYDETSVLRSCDMMFQLWPAPPPAP